MASFVADLPPDAALWRSLNSPRQWGWMEHMLAAAVHAGQAANWQRAGGKGRRPKPLTPPGTPTTTTTTIGSSMPADVMRRLLDEWSGAADDLPAGLLGPDGSPIDREEVSDGD